MIRTRRKRIRFVDISSSAAWLVVFLSLVIGQVTCARTVMAGEAMGFAQQSIRQRIEGAQQIVRATVIRSRPFWRDLAKTGEGSGRAIYTKVTLETRAVVKGAVFPDTFSYEIPGGQIGGTGTGISHGPGLPAVVGESEFLFVHGKFEAPIEQRVSALAIHRENVLLGNREVTVREFIAYARWVVAGSKLSIEEFLENPPDSAYVLPDPTEGKTTPPEEVVPAEKPESRKSP